MHPAAEHSIELARHGLIERCRTDAQNLAAWPRHPSENLLSYSIVTLVAYTVGREEEKVGVVPLHNAIQDLGEQAEQALPCGAPLLVRQADAHSHAMGNDSAPRRKPAARRHAN
jgi:hypothetical protein